MLITIQQVLNTAQLQNIQVSLSRGTFVDGRLSAGLAARNVKNNEELVANAQMLELLNNTVMGSLVKHPTYQAAAMPLRVATPFYARYTPGKAYGDHVDDPVMGTAGQLYRSDISTTVFLNDPSDYDGGELVINTAFGLHKVKLSAGDAVLYPSSSLHHVAEVTRGVRLVAVTWAQSMVRDPSRRELLYTLYRAKESLMAKDPNGAATNQVNTAYVNLVRMWSDV
jgi:PKHD-type hydroxylase